MMAVATTKRRLRRLVATRKLNIPDLTDLIDQVGTANDDALVFGNAAGHDQMRRIERFGPHWSRFETLRFDMQPYDRLATGTTRHGIAPREQTGDRRAALGHYGDRLSHAKIGGRIGNGELHNCCVLLQRPTEALIAREHRKAARRLRSGVRE